MVDKLRFVPVILLLVFLGGCSGGSSGEEPIARLSEEDRSEVSASLLEMFDAMDANQDGYLSKAEAKVFFDARFEEKDTNNDQMIEQSDLTDDPNTTYIIPYDQDGDGVATREEYDTYYRNVFHTHLDQNGDGKVSKEEFVEAFGLSFGDIISSLR